MNKIKYLIRQRRKHSKPSSALILNETFSNKTCLCSKLYDIPCSTDSLIIKQLLKHYSFYLLARLLLSNPPQVWIVLSSFWQGRPSCAAYFTHWPFFSISSKYCDVFYAFEISEIGFNCIKLSNSFFAFSYAT